MHRKAFTPQPADEERLSKARNQVMVPENSVILALVSGKVRTVYTEEFHGAIAFPEGFIKVLKPKDGTSAKYLAALLSTEVVAKQIQAQTVGVTIPRLTKLDISSIIVPLHESPEEKEQLISQVISSEMSELEAELQETLDKHKREVRSTRHAMIQTLSSLSSKWEQLNLFSNLNNGTLKKSDIIGRVNPISVEELMSSIAYSICTLQLQVETLRLEQADFGHEEAIDPFGFINSYIEHNRTPSFQMVNVGNDNQAEIPVYDEKETNIRSIPMHSKCSMLRRNLLKEYSTILLQTHKLTASPKKTISTRSDLTGSPRMIPLLSP